MVESNLKQILYVSRISNIPCDKLECFYFESYFIQSYEVDMVHDYT